MMAKGFFLTGTDTDVGKTVAACALLRKLAQAGYSTVAVKPVAAGCEQSAEGLRNGDALNLQAAMTAELPYQQLNPVALEAAIAPHIAAEQEGRALVVERLAGVCRGVLMRPEQVCIIEGAGGWRVPLNPRETLADLATRLQLPVIMVVGMRLGCLNHALLTAEAIAADGLQLAGWVANSVDPAMSEPEANFQSLCQRLAAPCLGRLPWLDAPQDGQAADFIDINPLIATNYLPGN
jgi:dethiobiotin synthetase